MIPGNAKLLKQNALVICVSAGSAARTASDQKSVASKNINVLKCGGRMKDNTVNVNGVNVYEHKIYELCDEYISNLDADIKEAENKITKKSTFRGMLKYIYKNLFKPKKGENIYNNSIKRNSNLDYDDIELLNDIWDIYTELCYRYSQDPSLLNFSVLTGISSDWFNDVKKGK